MHLIADGVFDLTDPRTATGQLALRLTLVHAIWATVIARRGSNRAPAGFHRYSLFVWPIWRVAYIGGMVLAMSG